MSYAPVVIFAYNRPQHLRRVLESLSRNVGADNTELYIYCDGVKESATPEDKAKIHEVQTIANTWAWCGRQKIVYVSDRNKGLGPSVIEGVSKIIAEYKKVIVVEDDLVLSPYFLQFMNQCLDVYEDHKSVFQISGYMYPIEVDQEDFCFLQVCSSWGWATWQDRWAQLRTDTQNLKNEIEQSGLISKFNLDGSYPMVDQLDRNISGQLKTWAIKWYATTFLAKGLVIHPSQSLVFNDGFDGSGSNCGESSEFQVNLRQTAIPVYLKNITEDVGVRRRLVSWLKRVNGIPEQRRIIDRVKRWFLSYGL